MRKIVFNDKCYIMALVLDRIPFIKLILFI